MKPSFDVLEANAEGKENRVALLVVPSIFINHYRSVLIAANPSTPKAAAKEIDEESRKISSMLLNDVMNLVCVLFINPSLACSMIPARDSRSFCFE